MLYPVELRVQIVKSLLSASKYYEEPILVLLGRFLRYVCWYSRQICTGLSCCPQAVLYVAHFTPREYSGGPGGTRTHSGRDFKSPVFTNFTTGPVVSSRLFFRVCLHKGCVQHGHRECGTASPFQSSRSFGVLLNNTINPIKDG